MLKKHLLIALTCSIITGSLKPEETQQSYVTQLWNHFTKRLSTIARYGNPGYMVQSGCCSFISAALGRTAWLSRNDMIRHLKLDANGNSVGNTDELFAWLQKANAAGAEVAVGRPNIETYKTPFITNTGESFTHTMETTLEPYASSFEYKFGLGTAVVTGCIALYYAYNFFTRDFLDRPLADFESEIKD